MAYEARGFNMRLTDPQSYYDEAMISISGSVYLILARVISISLGFHDTKITLSEKPDSNDVLYRLHHLRRV